VAEVAALEQQDPQNYRKHPSAKLLAALVDIIEDAWHPRPRDKARKGRGQRSATLTA